MTEPIAKIDTQGMSGPTNPNYDPKKDKTKHKPMQIKPRRLHTPDQIKELKILLNEVLDEREGKMDYISYFDTDHFKYRVGGEEPPYEDWSIK